MNNRKINRRLFIRNTTLAATALTLTGKTVLAGNPSPSKNPLPRWRGFNLLDYFSPSPSSNEEPDKTTEDDFKWMVDWGFDFVRLPMAYPRYLSFDRSKDITIDDVYKTDQKVLDDIDQLIFMAQKHGLHVSLNLHRAPGYCINAGFHEPFNLWKEKKAQDAFRAVSPKRLIVADGNSGGNDVIPEVIDLNIAQSCRGYWPHLISHYQAPWVWKDPSQAPAPAWPGTMEGKYYGREQLEEFYKPWIDLLGKGVGVHCGECGCWKKTPHEIFLAWFGDIIDILTKNGIGYSLWNFRGDFGILDSGRTDVKYTDWYGHKLDSKLLELLKKY